MILVVEPDETDFRHVESVLKRLGHDVLHCHDAEELLSRQDDEIGGHCIVSEIALPGIDGIAMIRELRERHLQSPVIFLSNNPEIRLVVEAFRAKAVDYLTKPFIDRELASKIDRFAPRH